MPNDIKFAQKSMAARKKPTAMPHQRIIKEAQAII
jgi:hypothetical protein